MRGPFGEGPVVERAQGIELALDMGRGDDGKGGLGGGELSGRHEPYVSSGEGVDAVVW